MRKLSLYALPLVGFSGSLLAAVPAEVTTALADAKTDAITIATAVLLIVFAVVAFKYMKSAK